MKKGSVFLAMFILMVSLSANAQRFIDRINPGTRTARPSSGTFLSTIRTGSTIKDNQIIRYNDGGRFYGSTIDGRRVTSRLIEPNGVESLGGFDENGRWNGTVEVTYPAERSWYKGEFSHGTKHGSGSLYKDGKYYDQQYYENQLETSIEVSEPRYKGENWYAKTLGSGTPSHPFYGSGGAGTYQEDKGEGGIAPCPQCDGSGYFPVGGKKFCLRCGGVGFIVIRY